PTNHLDLEGIESLAAALNTYDGTLIFVAHDRWFVSAVATRIIEITPERIENFPGTYVEYLRTCDVDHLDAESVLAASRRSSAPL
ncbi:MAG: ABC-F family ATPase, partial [Myxococcales bacterium]|nr:ABC-F family ATPase [Myxococcales bacterium]